MRRGRTRARQLIARCSALSRSSCPRSSQKIFSTGNRQGVALLSPAKSCPAKFRPWLRLRTAGMESIPAVVEAVVAPPMAADCPGAQPAQQLSQEQQQQQFPTALPLPIMSNQQKQHVANDKRTELIVGRSMVNIQGSLEEGWGEAERLMAHGQGTPPFVHMMRQMAPMEAATS